jgi:hypothetical protein
MKADPTRLIRAHYETLVDDRTGAPLLSDYVVFVGFPALVVGVCRWRHVSLPSAASGGLLTVAGLLSAFLFGVMLQVAQRALDWADSNPAASKQTTEHSTFMRELAANSGYAALVSFVAAGVFVVASVTSGTVLLWFSAVGLGMMAHLAVALLMVIRRVFALTEQRLRLAETAAEVRRLPREKKAS